MLLQTQNIDQMSCFVVNISIFASLRLILNVIYFDI